MPKKRELVPPLTIPLGQAKHFYIFYHSNLGISKNTKKSHHSASDPDSDA